MKMAIKSGVSGYHAFYIRDEFGNIERGRGGQPVYTDNFGNVRPCGHFAKNLITDLGMNAIRFAHFISDSQGTLRTWLKIATGSSNPDEADTNMDGYVTQSLDTGGFLTTRQQGLSDDGKRIRMERTINKIWANNTGAGVNVGSLGLSSDQNNVAHVKWLPVNESGNPTVINIPNGKSLHVIHTAVQEVPTNTDLDMDVVETDVSDNEVSTTKIKCELLTTTEGTNYNNLFEPRNYAGTVSLLSDIVVNIAPLVRVHNLPIIATYTAQTSKGAYVNNSFEQKHIYRLSESQGNDTPIRALAIGKILSFTLLQGGFVINFKDGDSFTKRDTHRLDLELNHIWDRA